MNDEEIAKEVLEELEKFRNNKSYSWTKNSLAEELLIESINLAISKARNKTLEDVMRILDEEDFKNIHDGCDCSLCVRDSNFVCAMCWKRKTLKDLKSQIEKLKSDVK